MVFHESARELIQSLDRSIARLEQEVHVGDLMSFFITAYHLLERIEKAVETTTEEKSRASDVRKDPDVKLCREIANLEKHVQLDPGKNPNPRIADSALETGFGVGRYGRGGFGIGEQSVTLHLAGGEDRDALALARIIHQKLRVILDPGEGR